MGRTWFSVWIPWENDGRHVYPYLLHFGHFYLPTFGALAAVGLIAGLGLSQRTARLAGIDPEALWDAGLFAVLAAFAVSRALLAMENFREFRAFPMLLLAVPSLTASGLLLAVAATVAWLRWKGVPVLRAMDAWAPCGTLVWGFLALGHWAEGSDPGMRDRPVALYAAGIALSMTVAAYLWLRRSHGRVEQIAEVILVGVGVAQFFLSFLRQPGVEGDGGLDMLQWVALGMVATGGGFWVTMQGKAR